MKSRGLAFKLICFILLGTGAVFVSAFLYYYEASRVSVMKAVEENARNLAWSTVNRIDSILGGVEKVPLNFSGLLSTRRYGPEEIPHLVERMVAGNPEIYGSAIAFEPATLDPNAIYFAPYCYRKPNGRLVHSLLGDASYHYFTMDWYQLPKELRKPVWTEPYYDEGGGDIIMASFSAPFFRDRDGVKRFQGVVTADVSLSWLNSLVSEIRLYQSGHAFLISQNGVFITHSDSRFIMRQTVFSIAEERGSDRLRRIGQDMVRGGEGMVSLEGDALAPARSWLYYAPLTRIGWSLGIVIPDDELFADVKRLGREVIFIGAAGLLLIALIVMLIAHRITRPLKSLAETTVEIARGNLDTELPPITSGDEIGRLTVSFEGMRVALKEYVKNLTETTAAKERIESELKIARTIQMSFLPKSFPTVQGNQAFDLYAALEPARHIGGDLYDFFMLDEHHLFIAVGDVSDKGIPAALFMAVTKTLLKGIAEPDMPPSEILSRTNAELCIDNDSMMFVTLFCGVLDLRTGLLKYSNAGHEHPVFIRKGRDPEWFELPPGFVLGVMEDSVYETREATLEAGDTIVVYTDGVTEAFGEDGAMYSEARLMAQVTANASLPPKRLTEQIFDSVNRHSAGVTQSDDITVLIMSYRGSTP
ncbi:MAG: SpoIIE family protein phosphatase [Syntrophobacteraceae bacterium]